VDVAETPGPGQVRDSSILALPAQLAGFGVEVVGAWRAVDSEEALVARFEGLPSVDLVITSGGVSVGDRDFVRPTAERLGEVTGLEPESSTLRSDLEEARRKSAGGKRGVSEELKAGLSNRIAEAVRLFNQEEYAKAETVFRSVLVIDPYNSVARSYIARIGKQSETGAQEPPPPREFSNGVLELLKGRHEQAIRLLKIAAAGMEQDAGLHAYLGVAYCLRHRAAGKKEKESLRSAQAEFRRALEIDPSYTLDKTLFSKDVLDIFQGVRKK